MVTIAIIVAGLALLVAIYSVLRMNRVEADLMREIKSLKAKMGTSQPDVRRSATTAQPNRNAADTAQAPRNQNRRRNDFQQNEKPVQQSQPKKRNEFKQNDPRENERPVQQNERQPQQKEPQRERPPQQPRERTQQPPREKPKQTNTPKPRPLPMPDIDLEQIIEQEAPALQIVQPQEPAPEAFAARKYAIIPEDGVIRMHQLQLQPDSDSYIEVDMPQGGQGNFTNYRFNLSGNQAFVISQGIDRLENAFAFEKPSNRKVSRIMQQGDGVLAKTESGWRIQEKAKIDFR